MKTALFTAAGIALGFILGLIAQAHVYNGLGG